MQGSRAQPGGWLGGTAYQTTRRKYDSHMLDAMRCRYQAPVQLQMFWRSQVSLTPFAVTPSSARTRREHRAFGQASPAACATDDMSRGLANRVWVPAALGGRMQAILRFMGIHDVKGKRGNPFLSMTCSKIAGD